MQAYDLVVIGSGPGGQRAAIQAAKSGKRVAIIEKAWEWEGCARTPARFPARPCVKPCCTFPDFIIRIFMAPIIA